MPRNKEIYNPKSFLTEHRVGSYGSSSLDTENPDQLAQVHDKNSFELLMEEGKKSWIKLPESVNGTLIYFLLVENNSQTLEPVDFLKSLFFVGTPVFVTFYLQVLFLYTIWLSVPEFQTDPNICGTSGYVQMAVMGIFMIILMPSVSAVIRESLACLRSNRVCLTMDGDSEHVMLYTLKNPEMKKYLTFFLIVVPETIILSALWYVGSGFILTSESMGDIIINSVAIAFIMDIDNFCVEAFQTEGVCERANETRWESPWKMEETRLADGIPREVDPALIGTFTNVKKVSTIIVAAMILVAAIRGVYCDI